jgi:hypothetical protein
VDAILETLPDDDPGEDPWGGANLAQCGAPACPCSRYEPGPHNEPGDEDECTPPPLPAEPEWTPKVGDKVTAFDSPLIGVVVWDWWDGTFDVLYPGGLLCLEGNAHLHPAPTAGEAGQ